MKIATKIVRFFEIQNSKPRYSESSESISFWNVYATFKDRLIESDIANSKSITGSRALHRQSRVNSCAWASYFADSWQRQPCEHNGSLFNTIRRFVTVKGLLFGQPWSARICTRVIRRDLRRLPTFRFTPYL